MAHFQSVGNAASRGWAHGSHGCLASKAWSTSAENRSFRLWLLVRPVAGARTVSVRNVTRQTAGGRPVYYPPLPAGGRLNLSNALMLTMPALGIASGLKIDEK